MKTLFTFLFIVNVLFAALNFAFFIESGGTLNLVSGIVNGFAAWWMYRTMTSYA
jgi:hypothetical protein